MTTKDVIEKYISYRRSLGEQFMTESYTLKSFGRSVGEETALCSVSTNTLWTISLRILIKGQRCAIKGIPYYAASLPGLCQEAICMKALSPH